MRPALAVGRQGRKLRRSFATRAAAEQWRLETRAAAGRGQAPVLGTVTVREAAARLVAGMASGTVRTRSGDPYKPSVCRGYESVLRLHVLGDLGGVKLARLRRRDIQALADRLLASGLDPATIRNALMPLRVVCRRAVEDGDLAVSPCTGIRLPAARGRRDRVASPAEAAALIAALRPSDQALWGTAFYAGLRLGELRALRWSDVDLAGGVIRVERSMDQKGATIAPKGRAGTRTVPIPRALRGLLAAHRLAGSVGEGCFGLTSGVPPWSSAS